MNKPLSVVLLLIGAVLLFYGFNASSSLSSDVSRAVTGSPTDKSIGLLVLGGAAALLGLFGLLSGRGSKLH
jgi:hypothetical protein